MKPTRARLLANLSLALALAVVSVVPALLATDAGAQVISPADRCRANLAKGSRAYLTRVLQARMDCENRIVDGLIPAATNCMTGRGDDILDLKLTRAEYRLTKIGSACTGVNLTRLGFPGSCQDLTGAPFDTADFQRCILDHTKTILASLLDAYYPPLSGFVRGSKAACLKGAPVDAAQSFVRTLAARERCALGIEYGIVDSSVLCRNEILPYGPGTGSDNVDRDIARSYLYLLGAIPPACVDVQIDDLNYQSSCTDPTGGPFTIYDLKQCLFDLNGSNVLTAMALVFPTEPVCGDGVKAGDEECDLGTGNSDTKPNTCRTNCKLPHCHDGVVDSGEQCDDGNTIDTDCCIGNCINPVCGDGIKECTEACDNGTNNSNQTPDACRTNCVKPFCGDGVTDPSNAEECDDGNTVSGDLCSSACIIEFCGDGIIQPGLGEECDDAELNSDTTPDACRTNCKKPHCGDGVVDPSNKEDCDDGNTNNADSCPNTCAVCGNNKTGPGETCDGTDPGSCPAGQGCVPGGCSTCAPACPSVGELVLYAGIGRDCTTNADCPAGSCDPTDSRCHTATRLDSGWTGLAHNADINDEIHTRGFLDCAGHGPTCGLCNVGDPVKGGIDPSTGSCRCTNDNRTICDKPFVADATHCGATNNTCDCYFGAPFPLASGGTPACVVNRFAQDISGTANVDLGSGEITAKLRTKVYLGISTTSPCPVCGGKCSQAPQTCTTNNDCTVPPDGVCLTGTCSNACERDIDCGAGHTCIQDIPNDGVRGGACIDGGTPGLPCDVTGRNVNFPAFGASQGGGGGGGYSLDCLPSVGKNVSGEGLAINLTQTTGTSHLDFNLSCSSMSPELRCPCLVCSGDPTVPCNSNAECAAQQGSCALSSSLPPARCSLNADCNNLSAGTCGGATHRCSKATSIQCTSNTDCTTANLGPCNPSTCSAKGLGSNGTVPFPNQCVNLDCTDLGNGTGTCTTGPDYLFCDGVTKANGGGILACQSDDSCSPSSVGFDAGTCTLTERQGCFSDPVNATGKPDPSKPIGASTFCIPPTDNGGINDVAGLPGPGRILNQATAKTFCKINTSKQYIPGVGGCLAP